MDITEKIRNNFFAQTWFHPNALNHRVVLYRGWKAGQFSTGETLQMFLPAILSPHKNALLKKYHAYVKARAFNDISASPKLMGSPILIKDGEETATLVDQIILSDQYHAKKYIKKESVVVDVGANIGIFSIFAAQFTDNDIFSFEPATATFELLTQNTAPYKNIHPIRCALSDKNGHSIMAVKKDTSAENIMEDSPIYEKSPTDTLEKVEMRTLDSMNLPKVDFIKIDTEGYEENVLLGARDTIQRCHPIITMSAYHRDNDKVRLPEVLKSICPQYVCELSINAEEDLICYVKK